MTLLQDQVDLRVETSDSDLDRLHAARDRAAAALDRVEAALDRKRAESHLQQTYRDDLTGALQRDCGRDRLGDEVARAHRTGAPLVLAFLDVVGLKATNDTYGHAAGDLVLSAVGAAVLAGLRHYDVVVRYGGDEFVCCLPHSSLADASRRLEEVTERLEAGKAGIELSIGLAELRGGESLDRLIERADRAMYRGRGTAGASLVLSPPLAE